MRVCPNTRELGKEEGLKKIWNRIYADYLMPSRLDEYERLLQASIEAGYQHVTLPAFYALCKNKALSGKYFIHRHDIDTDPKTARKMFNLERNLGIRSSYYFRLSTLDVPLMKEIHQYGSEVGYHYEELATYCKRHRILSPKNLTLHHQEIRDQFELNVRAVTDLVGFPIRTIASHGDFANRKLGVPNYAFIDREFMDRLNIDFECYDPFLISHYNETISDTTYPMYYKPYSPVEALKRNPKVIYLLTHPRHWRTAPWLNFLDTVHRIREGVSFN
jgi:hypothetical protein